jgi:hypothetical protein
LIRCSRALPALKFAYACPGRMRTPG